MDNVSDDIELGDDLVITSVRRQPGGFGTWICGRLKGHRVQALVFPEHAKVAEWELGESRISKLWLQRIADRRTVFNWDRGADVGAVDAQTRAIVDFLGAGLAEHIFLPRPASAS